MRRLFIMFMLLSVIVAAGCASPPEGVPEAEITGEAVAEIVPDGEVPINMERSSFSFEGYGPGKSHPGTFTDWEGTLMMKDGEVVGGEGVIQATSVTSDGERLENHLRSADFLDAEANPEIRFKTTAADGETMIGELTFRGVTKQVAFPYTTEEGEISADFLLDAEPFGMNHPAADSTVRITFTFSQ